MKKSSEFISTFFLCFVLILSYQSITAQIWKKIKSEVKNRTENKVVNKAGNVTDKAIDNTADAVKGSENRKEPVIDNADNTNTSDTNVIAKNILNNVSESSYKSYDFVPGDKIIFEPDLSSEADAELPARFIIHKGNAEIQSYEGEKIIHLDKGGYATISPLMSSDNYLPEQFTVEFDMMYENDKSYFDQVSNFWVSFIKPEEKNYESYPLYKFLLHNQERVTFGDNNAGGQSLPADLIKSVQTNNAWHHIAIYVRKNIAKAYLDQYRVSASNTMPAGAGKIYVRTDGNYGVKIKNFRLAAGGDDKYNKIVTDGKFITHGILFDVNKSGIKPESMGALNEIVKMMKEHADLKFEIDGHTDSDGKADANLILSQERADAVKAKLSEMGIDNVRLTTKGFGDTNPVDKNDSAEGKANNRRVEFVKK